MKKIKPIDMDQAAKICPHFYSREQIVAFRDGYNTAVKNIRERMNESESEKRKHRAEKFNDLVNGTWKVYTKPYKPPTLTITISYE